jgi:hypothetical protein
MNTDSKPAATLHGPSRRRTARAHSHELGTPGEGRALPLPAFILLLLAVYYLEEFPNKIDYMKTIHQRANSFEAEGQILADFLNHRLTVYDARPLPGDNVSQETLDVVDDETAIGIFIRGAIARAQANRRGEKKTYNLEISKVPFAFVGGRIEISSPAGTALQALQAAMNLGQRLADMKTCRQCHAWFFALVHQKDCSTNCHNDYWGNGRRNDYQKEWQRKRRDKELDKDVLDAIGKGATTIEAIRSRCPQKIWPDRAEQSLARLASLPPEEFVKRYKKPATLQAAMIKILNRNIQLTGCVSG